MESTTINPYKETTFLKYVSWSAIFSGALVGLGLSFLLNLFSIGIGLAAFPTSTSGITALAIGGFIALLIGSIVSMFALGWVAGYLTTPKISESWLGVIHGFLGWCAALFLMILLAAPTGAFVTAYSKFINSPNVSTFERSKTQTQDTTKDNTVSTLNQTLKSNPEAAADVAGKTALVIFFLFLVGAISSCFGGYVGYIVNRSHERESRNKF